MVNIRNEHVIKWSDVYKTLINGFENAIDAVIIGEMPIQYMIGPKPTPRAGWLKN
jgi:hypothetical protein